MAAENNEKPVTRQVAITVTAEEYMQLVRQAVRENVKSVPQLLRKCAGLD